MVIRVNILAALGGDSDSQSLLDDYVKSGERFWHEICGGFGNEENESVCHMMLVMVSNRLKFDTCPDELFQPFLDDLLSSLLSDSSSKGYIFQICAAISDLILSSPEQSILPIFDHCTDQIQQTSPFLSLPLYSSFATAIDKAPSSLISLVQQGFSINEI